MMKFKLGILLLGILFLAACGSSKRDPLKEMQPIGAGCFGPRSETVKMLPVDCAKRGKVTPTALQKCVLGAVGERCAQYNSTKPNCLQACVEHVKRTKF